MDAIDSALMRMMFTAFSKCYWPNTSRGALLLLWLRIACPIHILPINVLSLRTPYTSSVSSV